MSSKTRTIEIDEAVADALEREAVARGISLAALLAAMVHPEDAANDSDDVAELDRRWAKAKGGSTVAHDDVAVWLDTWGSPDFKTFPAE
jgi:predicted transcriptional regulator